MLAGQRYLSTSPIHQGTTPASVEQTDILNTPSRNVNSVITRLPLCCPGCGAPSQIVEPNEAGYYSLTRSAVKTYLEEEKEEHKVFREVLSTSNEDILQKLGIDDATYEEAGATRKKVTPICERCHNLLHESRGESIYHPSIDSIQDIIQQSPYKHNHIYHIVDAADFPMSLIPSLQHDLRLPRLRTQNRRSKSQRYMQGRVAEVSFIVTRSDLLGAQKKDVDKLMPYLREVLRDALGSSRKNVRLGNIRCVSALRGWWTTDIKADVWERGGAGWMVGKVNVGKSSLFQVVFPKGTKQNTKTDHSKLPIGRNLAVAALSTTEDKTADEIEKEEEVGSEEELQKADLGYEEVQGLSHATSNIETEATTAAQTLEPHQPNDHEWTDDKEDDILFDEDEDSLLPPAQPETQFPVMPIASHLAGTTASPIRVPFGNGKGELIDLPGVARSMLDDYVKPLYKNKLFMRDRPKPAQLTIKPGQSLVVGDGLIRITPKTEDMVFLAHGFVNLSLHITSTFKAIEMQEGTRKPRPDSILGDNAPEVMQSAGSFPLRWDVTKTRAGPLTRGSAVGLRPDRLPFVVYSSDILIEGVGWIEFVAQVRRRKLRGFSEEQTERYRDPFAEDEMEEEFVEQLQDWVPEVEVFTPKGKFIASRPPMNASLIGGAKEKTRSDKKSRPRASMKSLKLSQRGREGYRG